MNLSHDNRIKRCSEWVIKNESACFVAGVAFAALTFICAGFWIAGNEIEPVTFILSLIASFFFALPPIAKRITEARPIERMNFDEIMELVANSEREDWKGVDLDGAEERFYLRDPRLRLRHISGEKGIQNYDFYDEWANNFHEPKAIGYWYDIYYDTGLLKRVLLVSIDSHRVTVPCPEQDKKTIKKLSYTVGKIFAYHVGMYEEYIERLNFEIKNDPTNRSEQ